MLSRFRVDAAFWVAVASVLLAIGGWWMHSVPLAAVGVLGVGSIGLLFVWQRECLTGVTYTGDLTETRAMFGEVIGYDVELCNDKLLPLTWLHVEDDVPSDLDVGGGTVVEGTSARADLLVQLLPMLPYQRVRRHFTVRCDHRGLHTFGPARVTSGDPVGYRRHSTRTSCQVQVLVYPKIFTLEPAGIASAVPLGNHRAVVPLPGDPSRVAGVREYRPGDPLRHVDWRASARGGGLLVREFEQTATLRVALFLDMAVPQLRPSRVDPPELEFAIAVGASLVADLAGRGLGVGLYASGTVRGVPVSRPPSSSPEVLPQVLDLLARASPFGSTPIADVLIAESHRMQHGTSVVVVAADFTEPTLIAISELRRRSRAVTAVWVATDRGNPPPPGLVDTTLIATFTDDWTSRPNLDLAP